MDIELIVRTTAVLLGAGAIVALLRRAAPSTRHLVWHIAIVAVLLAPILVPLAPKITVPGVPRVPEVPGVVFERVPGVANALVTERGTQQNLTLGTIGTPGTLGTVGFLGSLFVGSWFMFCWLLSGLSVWRGSRPAPESWLNEARVLAKRLGLRGPISVRQSHQESSPHVAGLFRSVVMMPPSAVSWTVETRQAALVHELTHIRRHDRRTQAIAHLACAIYWFNPLVWYAASGLARERERACDDQVLNFGAKPSAYATLLLDIARTAKAWTPATALSMARPSAIEGRLLSILADAARTPRRSTRWLVGLAIVGLTTAILGAQGAGTIMPATAEAALSNEQAPQPAAPIVKPQAVMALDDQIAVPSIISALVDALGDSDRQVREQAAMGLAITPGSEVVNPLLNALKDPDSQVREKAAIGLAFRRDPRIVEPLLTAIEDRDSQVREKAAIALGSSGDPRAVNALTKAMKDPDSQVREKAVAGLILLGIRK
jgi:beta-lactamase regulating signal transducer with metallopeptidase domain